MTPSKPESGTAPDTPHREFVITRVLDAPRDLVWKAWSEPERLAQWWGPKECKLHFGSLEFQPGGIFHYGMEWPGGNLMWGRFLYRVIVPPEKLVFVVSFADEQKNIVRAPFSPTWPLEMLNTVTLTEHGGKTKLTLTAVPINPTDEERTTYEGWFASLEQGYGGTFDALAAYLAKA